MADNSCELFKELKCIYNQNRLIPFVGAGFSANIKGYPTWDKSIDLLEEECSGCKAVSDDNLDRYQYAYWCKGPETNVIKRLLRGKHVLRKNFLTKVLQKPIENLEVLEKKDMLKALEQHILLINSFDKIYTTNWDQLIEFSCQKINKHYESYYTTQRMYPYGSKYHLNKDISNDSEIIKIIKYHGCISDKTSTSLIASAADYHERISSLYVHPLDQELYWDMSEKSILFLGYSLRDINMKYIMNQVLFEAWRRPKTSNFKFYLIEFGEPPSDGAEGLAYWRQCNLTTTVYLFEKNHFYNDLVSLSDDGKDKTPCSTDKHDNCKKPAADWDAIKKKVKCVAQERDDDFRPLIIDRNKSNDYIAFINSLEKNDSSCQECLHRMIGSMRKEAITNFLKYITNTKK